MLYKFLQFINEGITSEDIKNVENIIKNKCIEKGYEFRGFVNGEYKGKDTNLILYCPKHNLEWSTSTVNNFKRDKSKCPECSKESRADLQMIPENVAIEKIKKICNYKNYEFRGFVDNKWVGKKTYLILYCKKHNIEWRTTIYESLISGKGCPECGKEISRDSKRYSQDEAENIIINKCKELGYNFIGFVDGYINEKSKIILNCPKHKNWYSTYNNFQRGSGCPICNQSKGEQKIAEILEKHGFVYLNNMSDRQPNVKYFMRQYTFDDCRSDATEVKRSRKMPFDFYLIDYNICIEYDGRQHYEPAFGQNNLELTKRNDQIKTEYCNDQNGRPKLIRITYLEYKNIEDILKIKLNIK